MSIWEAVPIERQKHKIENIYLEKLVNMQKVHLYAYSTFSYK